jgi:hypothetical protein
VLTASRVHPQERELETDVGLCASANVLRALGNQVLESHAAAPVVVRIRGVDPDGDVSVKTTVRGLLDADDAAPLPLTPITLPAGPGVGDLTMRGTAATAPPNGGH